MAVRPDRGSVLTAGGIYDLDKEREHEGWPDVILDPATIVDGLQLNRWVLDFAYAKNPIPKNGSRGNHRAHARLVRAVRTVTKRYAGLYQVPALERCTVALTWYVLTSHRRDTVNLADTLKAMQDGLVDAGVVSDDTPDVMNTIMPAIVRVDPLKHRAGWMELVITRWDGQP